jgi:hypothetical protein
MIEIDQPTDRQRGVPVSACLVPQDVVYPEISVDRNSDDRQLISSAT